MVEKKQKFQAQISKDLTENAIEDPGEYSPDAAGSPAMWTWPTVTLACVLVPAALTFALVLIVAHIATPWTVVWITVVLVGGILTLVTSARNPGAKLQWLLGVLHAMAGRPSGPQ
ncbi:hypothetical protein ACFXHA_43220 [Nocardia sp. NPDC059240]|uniref:hypothetical protein n=1 Tax=Nocardia sp. NPDC059240 TaxID=3346786 RepID=UPI00368ADA08